MRRLQVLGILVIGVFFLVFLYLGAADSHAVTVTITGSIYKQGSNDLVTDAAITIQVWRGGESGPGDWIAETDPTTTGTYTIVLSGMASETVLYVSTNNGNSSNYVNEWWTGHEGDRSSYRWEDAVDITVPEGISSITYICNFDLESGHTISGKVVDNEGHPLADIPVMAFRGKCWDKPPITDTLTGADGKFYYRGMANDTYYLLAPARWDSIYCVPEWYDNIPRDQCWKATPVVVAGADVSNINFELQKSGIVTGTVRNSNGENLEGVQLTAFLLDENDETRPVEKYYECSGGGGTFFMSLPPGKYIIKAGGRGNCWNEKHYDPQYYRSGENVFYWDGATPIDVIEGQTVENIDFSLKLATLYLDPGVTGVESDWSLDYFEDGVGTWLVYRARCLDWHLFYPDNYTFTVTFPKGDTETYTGELSTWGYFSKGLDRDPETGDYVFVLETPDGRRAKIVDHVEVTDVFEPDPSNFSVSFDIDSGDTTDTSNTTPTISWEAVEGARSYRVKIYTPDRTFVYCSPWLDDSCSYKVPPGVLKPGTEYLCKIQASNERLDEGSLENRKPERDNLWEAFATSTFTTPGEHKENSPPVIDVSKCGVYNYNIQGMTSCCFYLTIRDPEGATSVQDGGDIVSVRVSGPKGTEMEGPFDLRYYTFGYGHQKNQVDYSKCVELGTVTVPSGDYVFTVIDSAGHEVIVTETLNTNDIDTLPCGSKAGLRPYDGAILTPSTLHFSWTPIEGASRYSIRFYDLFKNEIARFSLVEQNSTELRMDEHADLFQENGVYRWRVLACRENKFNGENLNNESTRIREFDQFSTFVFRKYAGDFDGDEDVDRVDLETFAQNFGRTDCDKGALCRGDFWADLDVDGGDLAVFASEYKR